MLRVIYIHKTDLKLLVFFTILTLTNELNINNLFNHINKN